MESTIYTSITISTEFAEEMQHALMGAISSDWSLETNLGLMDLVKGIQYEMARLAKRDMEKAAEEDDAIVLNRKDKK